MSHDLLEQQLGPNVTLWRPETDLLHDPNITLQEPPSEEVFLGLPIGECGGVVMANEVIAEIDRRGMGTVYGNHAPTHGADSVAAFEAQGARFGVDPTLISLGMPYVISAHGAAPGVAEAAQLQGLKVFDVTCPLVKRTHVAIEQATDGHVAYISFGSREHPELIGAAGVAERAQVPFTVISTPDDIDRLLAGIEPGTRVTIVGQTTNNSDDAGKLAKYLKDMATARAVQVARDEKYDVCHTVRDRQHSTRQIVAAYRVGTLVVVGSVNSKNTGSLAKVAAQEAIAHEVPLDIYLTNSWHQLPVLEGRVGVVSGASTLERNVRGVITHLAPTKGVTIVGEDTDKGIVFKPVDAATRALLEG